MALPAHGQTKIQEDADMNSPQSLERADIGERSPSDFDPELRLGEKKKGGPGT